MDGEEVVAVLEEGICEVVVVMVVEVVGVVVVIMMDDGGERFILFW